MPEIFNQAEYITGESPTIETPHPQRKRFTPFSIKNDVPTHHPLGSFLIKPKRLKLNILEQDEEVILILREHPIQLLGRIFIILILIVATIIFSRFTDVSIIPQIYLSEVGLLWFLFLFGMIFERIVSWYFNTIVITDERIIDIDFFHLIYKNITSTKIDNIEDVTYSITGVLPSLLNYGNVLIQTAGAVVSMAPQQTTASIEIWNTPNPAKIVNVVNELMLQEEQEKLEGRAK